MPHRRLAKDPRADAIMNSVDVNRPLRSAMKERVVGCGSAACGRSLYNATWGTSENQGCQGATRWGRNDQRQAWTCQANG